MVNGKSRMHANTNSRKYFPTRIYTDLHCFLGSILLIRVHPRNPWLMLNVESDDHFECIMQNKANSPRGKMNAKGSSQRDYENKTGVAGQQNKAKQSQY